MPKTTKYLVCILLILSVISTQVSAQTCTVGGFTVTPGDHCLNLNNTDGIDPDSLVKCQASGTATIKYCGVYGCYSGTEITDCFDVMPTVTIPNYSGADIVCPAGTFSLVRVINVGSDNIQVLGCGGKCKTISYDQYTCAVAVGETSMDSSEYGSITIDGPLNYMLYLVFHQNDIKLCVNYNIGVYGTYLWVNDAWNYKFIAKKSSPENPIVKYWALDRSDYPSFIQTSGNPTTREYFVIDNSSYVKCVKASIVEGDRDYKSYDKYKRMYGETTAAFIFCNRVKYLAPTKRCQDSLAYWYMNLNTTPLEVLMDTSDPPDVIEALRLQNPNVEWLQEPMYPGSTDESNIKRWNALVDVNEMPANDAVGHDSSRMFKVVWNKIFMVSPSLDDISNNILWTKNGQGSLYAGGGFERKNTCPMECDATGGENNTLDGCDASLTQTDYMSCKCSSEQHASPIPPDKEHCTNDSMGVCAEGSNQGDCGQVCRIEFEYDEEGVLGTTRFVLGGIQGHYVLGGLNIAGTDNTALTITGSGNSWLISHPAFTIKETGNMGFTIKEGDLDLQVLWFDTASNTTFTKPPDWTCTGSKCADYTQYGVDCTIKRRYIPSDNKMKFTVASDIVFDYTLFQEAGIFQVNAQHTYTSSGTQKKYMAACNRKICTPAQCSADMSLVHCCNAKGTYCWCKWGGCDVDKSGNIITTVPPTYKWASLKKPLGDESADCKGNLSIPGAYWYWCGSYTCTSIPTTANIFVAGNLYRNSYGEVDINDLPCGSYTLAAYNKAFMPKEITFEIENGETTKIGTGACKYKKASWDCINLGSSPYASCSDLPTELCWQDSIGHATPYKYRSSSDSGACLFDFINQYTDNPIQCYYGECNNVRGKETTVQCCGDWGCSLGQRCKDNLCFGGGGTEQWCGGRIIKETSACGFIQTRDEKKGPISSCSIGPITSEDLIEKIDSEPFSDSVTVPDYWFANVSRPRPDMDSGLPHANIRINGTIDRCLGPDSDGAAGNLDITMDPDLLVTFELHIGNYTFKPLEDVPIFADMPVEHVLYPHDETANKLRSYTFDDWYGYQQQEFNYPAQCNTLCPSNCMCVDDIRLPVCGDAEGVVSERTDCVCRADMTLKDTCLSQRSMHNGDFEDTYYDFAKTRTFENPYDDWQATESHINHTYSYSFEGLGPKQGDLISNVTYGTLAGSNERDYIISEEDVQRANITIYTFYENITIGLFPNTVNGASPRYAGDSNIVVEVFPRNGSKMKITSVYPGEFFLSPNTDMSLTGVLYDACSGAVLPGKRVGFDASDKGTPLPAAATTDRAGAALFAFRIADEGTTATITFEGDNTHTESKDSIYLDVWTFSSFWFLLSPDVILLIIIFIVGLLSYRFFRKGRIDFGGMWRQLRGED
ncbi:MAG: hypothetical protein MSIBF_03315 [Candidatus Altiarchaeales archaeon IMC4]|nr:MAG: hypothetical protein MSIBF_03315 [Candidatus Altiarchaeales archaeon IMC4]